MLSETLTSYLIMNYHYNIYQMKTAFTQQKLSKQYHLVAKQIRQQKKYESNRIMKMQQRQLYEIKQQIPLRRPSLISNIKQKRENIQNGSSTDQIIKNIQVLPEISHNFTAMKRKVNNPKSLFNNAIQIPLLINNRQNKRLKTTKDLSIHSANYKTNKQLSPIQQINKQERQKLFKIIRNQFGSLINTSNYIKIQNTNFCFIGFIQLGNNGTLVKQIMRRRWWWSIEDKNKFKANLIWTEWLNSSIIQKMQKIEQFKMDYNKNYEYQIQSRQKSTQKITSIKKIIDEDTFQKIKSNISQKQIHYFKKKNYTSNQFIKINQQQVSNFKNVQIFSNGNQKIHNHVQGCLNLHSKKLLFKNLSTFLRNQGEDPFKYIPLTFFIEKIESQAFQNLLIESDRLNENSKLKNIWICKPGENSNRGFGISVLQRQELKDQIIKRLSKNQKKQHKHTLIVQKYIEDCFLIYNRKFDIRCYILLTTVNGYLKGYWYQDGYIRTSSEQYTLDDTKNMLIHLTNDAIQKKCAIYGKFEDFNKVNFSWFKNYLKKKGFKQKSFDDAYDQMKKIAYYLIASVSSKIKRKQYTFQLFGLDFMLNSKMKPLLIEANSNPCLETSGIILSKIIYELVENVFMTAIDPIFPEPKNIKKGKDMLNKDYFASNKFELIYSDKMEVK